MAEWLDSVAGPGYTMAIFWTFGALLLLVVLLLAVKLFRSMTFGTFVAGGRNRKTRLAVMDATAVDSHRRLILVRRDDVEHLLLIGGPSDVVVERDIKLGPQRRVAMAAENNRDAPPQQQPTQSQAPAPRPRPPEQLRQPAQPASRAPAERLPQTPQSARGTENVLPPRLPPRAESARGPTPLPPLPRSDSRGTSSLPPLAPFNPAPRAMQMQSDDFDDDELLKELEVSLEETQDKPVATKRPVVPSLDDEMTKLLGELSTPRR